MPESTTINDASSASDDTAALSPEDEGATSDSDLEASAQDDDPQADDADGSEEDDPPPFHTHPAWKKRQEKIKALEAELESRKAWDPIVQQFKEQGMDTPDAVRAAAAEQEFRQAESTALAPLARQLNAAVEAGEMTQREAEEHFARVQQQRITEHSQQQLAAQRREGQIAKQLPALLVQYPQADAEDVAERALANPRATLKELAAQSHDRAMKIIARHVAAQTKKPAKPPMGRGASARPGSKTIADMSDAEFKKYKEEQLRAAANAGR